MGCCKVIKLISLLSIVGVVSFLVLSCYKSNYTQLNDSIFEDHYWGKKVLKDGEQLPKDDLTIRPFKVVYDEVVYKDLIDRLAKTRFVEPLENQKFENGFNGNYLKEVVNHWKTKYDWKKQIAYLNSYEQFKTQIEGIDVHFVRIKPIGSPKIVKPIVFLNGWPSSFYQTYKLADYLKKPVNDIAFEIIIPSRPGFGFSEQPHKAGFSVTDAVRVYVKLMKRLGHEKFFFAGEDWGAIEAHAIAAMYPDNVEGVHFGMGLADLTLTRIIKMYIGKYLPKLIYSNELEAEFFKDPTSMFKTMVSEMGYFMEQSTKPDTLAANLIDSPAGTAAWILEKYSFWVNKDFINLADGGLTKVLTLDELLTNVMIQWITGNNAYGVRYYKECALRLTSGQDISKAKVNQSVPAGFSIGVHEIDIGKIRPDSTKYNIVKFDYLQGTGHFSSFEAPKLVSEHLHKFVSIVLNQQKTKNVKNEL